MSLSTFCHAVFLQLLSKNPQFEFAGGFTTHLERAASEANSASALNAFRSSTTRHQTVARRQNGAPPPTGPGAAPIVSVEASEEVEEDVPLHGGGS